MASLAILCKQQNHRLTRQDRLIPSVCLTILCKGACLGFDLQLVTLCKDIRVYCLVTTEPIVVVLRTSVEVVCCKVGNRPLDNTCCRKSVRKATYYSETLACLRYQRVLGKYFGSKASAHNIAILLATLCGNKEGIGAVVCKLRECNCRCAVLGTLYCGT